jgi:dTDP-4-amino-4,6-dideoxygalactose transaminase
MTTIRESILIHASPDAIDAVALDPEQLHAWCPGVENAETDKVFPQAGGKMRVVYQTAGTTFDVNQTVLDYVPEQSITLRMGDIVVGTCILEYRSDAGSTLVTISAEYEMPEGVIGQVSDRHMIEQANVDNIKTSLHYLRGMVEARMPMRISSAIVAREYKLLKEKTDRAIERVLSRGAYTQDLEIAAFESDFAELCGVRYAVNTCSGVTALTVGLRALGIVPEDEVITAPYTCVSTTMPITNVGAVIRFADIEEDTLTLDPAQVERHITPKTRMILPVHIHGQVTDMDPLQELAEKYNLLLLEDAALSTGAEYRGRRTGSMSHAGAFSYAPSKILGGIGWGGMLVTNDVEVAARAGQFAGHGPLEPTSLPVPNKSIELLEGYSTQMSSLQAAGLRVKLPYLEGWNVRRREIMARLDAACDRLDIRRLHPPEWTKPTPRSYVILCESRDEIIQQLNDRGIKALAYYVPALHFLPAYKRLGYKRGDFPIAERMTEELICIPISPMMTDEEVGDIVIALEKVAA